ncbi:MAG: serine/threonine protein kinase [Gammaproteobacteria bacterium]|nr:serine/threonine protein kinase [Gammaproteobacteria bacterium]
MSIKVMITDGHADFRTLLMHHVTTHWSDAIITAYDPTTAGHLPEEFSGAGNDIILLGDQQGDRDGIKTLRQFLRRETMPPVFYFGKDKETQETAEKFGADAFFWRDDISHDALVVRMTEVLRDRKRIASTGSLFVGDNRTGIHPLVKGYRHIKRLAINEHSAVYLAEKESADIRVVLKVMRQVPDLTDGIGEFDRFLQEYEMIAELEHPNIVQIYDLGVSDDHAHIAMEYLSGGDLRQRITAGIAEPDAVRYLQEIASALAEIHEVGILHRDLKPGNIMLRADDSIALIDFGLAKRMRLKQEITGSGQIFGTPYYMSPEQGHANDVDARSDIYSLGVIFYEMLTGEKLYTASNAMGIIVKHRHAPIPVLPKRFAQYQELVNRMLAKQPENRLQRADEVSEWL